MTMMPTALVTPQRRSVARGLGLLALLAPAAFGLFVISMLGLGPFSLLVPVAVALAVYAMAKSSSPAVREVTALMLGAAGGFGLFVVLVIVGIGFDLVPFLMADHAYPYEDAWMVGSVVASVLGAVAIWLLLRKTRRVSR